MFTKVLVANRGEIAIRVFRTLREMGIASVAVYSEADRDSPFVARADEAYLIGPGPSAESYLRGDVIVDVARRSGAQAVHPGFGFLAENAGFARACAEAGLVFVGPPPEAIEAMASKDERARGDGGGRRADRARRHRGGRHARGGAADRRRDRLPGRDQGRGRRRRQGHPHGARRRASSSPPTPRPGARARPTSATTPSTSSATSTTPATSRCRCWPTPTATSSTSASATARIQRRHQKIVEETPSPAVSPELRDRIGAIAVDAARAVGYVGAGTVEGLLAADGSWYFLEMNTRLQVEHTITEMVTGLDLVREQIWVAGGRPLGWAQADVRLYGHAIQCRINAEDRGRRVSCPRRGG